MKILFVIPLTSAKDFAAHRGGFPYLGIGYICSYLKERGYELEILDMEIEAKPYDTLKARLDAFRPDITGVTFETCLYNEVKRTAEFIKSNFKSAHLVLGGPHATLLPEECLREMPADSVVIGEGEITFLELVRALENGKSLEGVAGTAIRENGAVRVNPPRERIRDIDALPFPALEYYKMNQYPLQRYFFRNRRFVPLISSRGCPFNCVYCNSKELWGSTTTLRGAENIVDEIELRMEQYNVDAFNFYDDTFTANMRRVDRFCGLIAERRLDIEWRCYSRVDTLNEAILSKMKASGLKSIALGIEHGNDEILKLVGKKITTDIIRNAVDMIRKAGIENINGFFMIGNMGETRETIQDTINFMRELKLDDSQVCIATPLPRTPLMDYAKKEGLLRTEDWSEFHMTGTYQNTVLLPVATTKDLTHEELRRILVDIQREFENVDNSLKGKIFRGIKNTMKIFIPELIWLKMKNAVYSAKRKFRG